MTLMPAMPDGPVRIYVKGKDAGPKPSKHLTSMEDLATWLPEFEVGYVQILCSDPAPNPAAAYEHFDEGVYSLMVDGVWSMQGSVSVLTALRAFDWAYHTNYAEGYPYV